MYDTLRVHAYLKFNYAPSNKYWLPICYFKLHRFLIHYLLKETAILRQFVLQNVQSVYVAKWLDIAVFVVQIVKVKQKQKDEKTKKKMLFMYISAEKYQFKLAFNKLLVHSEVKDIY